MRLAEEKDLGQMLFEAPILEDKALAVFGTIEMAPKEEILTSSAGGAEVEDTLSVSVRLSVVLAGKVEPRATMTAGAEAAAAGVKEDSEDPEVEDLEATILEDPAGTNLEAHLGAITKHSTKSSGDTWLISSPAKVKEAFSKTTDKLNKLRSHK